MPPLKILFVDDDSDESYLFNEALEHAGLEIELSKASNGNTLVTALLNDPLPDLVFMDINMPYKDGLEALTEIRNSPTLKHLPIIIYSTSKNTDSINSCFEKGADLYVVKPHDFDGMVKVVSKICTMDWSVRRDRSREDFVISEEQFEGSV